MGDFTSLEDIQVLLIGYEDSYESYFKGLRLSNRIITTSMETPYYLLKCTGTFEKTFYTVLIKYEILSGDIRVGITVKNKNNQFMYAQNKPIIIKRDRLPYPRSYLPSINFK